MDIFSPYIWGSDFNWLRADFLNKNYEYVSYINLVLRGKLTSELY